jgi:hypothetical protein
LSKIAFLIAGGGKRPTTLYAEFLRMKIKICCLEEVSESYLPEKA